jgi:glycosyltransferase involved in cell wall biosynthesis
MIDVFVNVSRNESFGVSVIESSACMKPVVVSDVGGLPEVVIEGETGFHVPAEDAEQTAKAIDRLVNDPPLRKKMGEAGRIFVRENFSFAKNVSDTIRIYEQLLSKKNRQ